MKFCDAKGRGGSALASHDAIMSSIFFAKAPVMSLIQVSAAALIVSIC